MNFRKLNEQEKAEIMNNMYFALQDTFPSYAGVREAEFTTGADLEAIKVSTFNGKQYEDYGMFGEDAGIVVDRFNTIQDKYKASTYGQQGVHRFRIERRA